MEQILEQRTRNIESMLRQCLDNDNSIFKLLEKIMSTTQTGLAALQAFVTQFTTFEQQLVNDINTLSTNNQALTTAINQAISDLGSSEDPQVQALVTQLQTALTAAQSSDTTLESVNANLSALSSSLSTAEGGTGGTTAQAKAGAQTSKAAPASTQAAKTPAKYTP